MKDILLQNLFSSIVFMITLGSVADAFKLFQWGDLGC